VLIVNFDKKESWLAMVKRDFPSMSQPAKFISDSNGKIVAKQIPFNRMVELGLLVRKRGKYRLGFPNG
jgi:hypothetical protein